MEEVNFVDLPDGCPFYPLRISDRPCIKINMPPYNYIRVNPNKDEDQLGTLHLDSKVWIMK